MRIVLMILIALSALGAQADERSSRRSTISAGPPGAADPCERERAAGGTPSAKCRHPDFTGQGARYGYPNRRGYGAPDTVIINQGGTVIMPPAYRPAPPPTGGSRGSHSIGGGR